MLFNSIDFALFIPIVFAIYWLLRNQLQIQNLVILISSYIFYAWWDVRFLAIIGFSTMVDFLVGIFIQKASNTTNRKLLLTLSLIVNLGLLAFFKYFNFFAENFTAAFTFFGSNFRIDSLNIVLPVGISFYTFQTLSYTIDIYRNKLKPTNNFISFAAFVSFFPQLAAGPIERATNLLPQFFQKRRFNYDNAVDGLRQILWGFFKKVVIADNCAIYVTQIFDNSADYSASTLIVGGVLFTFQVYGDFSGYSDMAIGLARLFGFNLKQNFAFPFFSRDIAEFWRRWHISLSTWFRDYLYFPLGGSRGSKLKTIRNVFIVFTISGFWHGPEWTLVIWGFINAVYFLPLLILNKNRNYIDIIGNHGSKIHFKEIVGIIITFSFTVLSLIIFRSENLTHAYHYLAAIPDTSLFTIPEVRPSLLFLYIIILIVIEWIGREKQHALEHLERKLNKPYRYLFYYGLTILIYYYIDQGVDYIYFNI